MNNQIIRTINKYNLIENGDKIIVALSGGADSVTLLDILNSLKEKYDITVYAAHVNHNLRGEEADRDENFCKFLCEKYNIELFIKTADVKTIAQQQKISEELCGRKIRYEFFDELSKGLGAKIATAHTASDNAETLLFNIIRGSSVVGAGAIPPKRDNIIRPLIELTREQIENYCTEKDLEYITDSSNLSDDYTRNKIRHNVIPVLKQINPNFENNAMNLSENAREVSAYINSQSEIAIENSRCDYGYDCKRLISYDIAILKNAVVILCKNYASFSPESKHVKLIIDIIKNGGAVNLANGYKVVSKQGFFRIIKDEIAENFSEIILNESTTLNINNKVYSITINNSILENKLIIRTRKSSDTFTFSKRKITKPLRKAMNEYKIPSELRDTLIVIANGDDVLWCEQIGFSQQGEVLKNQNAFDINVNE